MTEALFKLASWLSPAYPVGAYTYSHGLEWAVGAGEIRDVDTAEAWIADCLEHGSGRNDAILLITAHRAVERGDSAEVSEICEFARALAPSAERLLEMDAQGRAFSEVTEAAWGTGTDQTPPYPVAVGIAAAKHRIAAEPAATMFLHAFASNLISTAVRLVPLGQTEGQKLLASLMLTCRSIVEEALAADIEDIGGCAIRSDIASMKHETQEVRLFRT